MPKGIIRNLVLAFLAGYGFIALVALGIGQAITARDHLRALQWGAVCLFASFTYFKIVLFLYRKRWFRRALAAPFLGTYFKILAILPPIAPMAAFVLVADNPNGSLWPLGVVIGMVAACLTVQEKILDSLKSDADAYPCSLPPP